MKYTVWWSLPYEGWYPSLEYATWDEAIEHVKKILTPEQFEKFKTLAGRMVTRRTNDGYDHWLEEEIMITSSPIPYLDGGRQ